MDEIAHALGIEPLELRRRNLAADGDLFSTGQPFSDTHFAALVEGVAGESASSKRLQSTRAGVARGRGVAVTVKTTVTPSTSTASLKLEEDGSLSLLVSTTEVGQGSRTVLAQIAADAVGVPLERVHQTYPDTALTPWDQTTSSSRSTLMMGDAVRLAAEEIRTQLRHLAADLLEAGEADVELGAGAAWVRGVPERRLTYADVVKRSRSGNVLGSGSAASEGHLDPETGQGIATNRFFQAACAAEVAVDLDTGRVTVEGLNLQTYAGQVVNPTLAELQSEGNVAFGVGQALLEEIVLDAGQVQNATLGDYMIPSLLDMPDQLEVGLLEDPHGQLHGLGESGAPVVPAAIGNAIFNACGARVRELPITPEKVLMALRARRDVERSSGPDEAARLADGSASGPPSEEHP
jgi:CO/xanthine dehydrogenase Mo-binding subunit